MLVSLGIRNFVLIEDASVDFARGLTCLSGETGAGKTLLTQALELLRGERAAEGLVGERGDDALIEAVFELGSDELTALPADAVDVAGLTPGELVATRRLHRSGRNRCFLNGTSVTLGTLGEVVGNLVSFSGQHEHRRLLEPAYQRVVLDAFGGSDISALLDEFGREWTAAREADQALAEVEATRVARDNETELLEFQTAELAAAEISVPDEEALAAEQRVLARAEELLQRTLEAAELLRTDGEAPDAGGLLHQARSRLMTVADVDPALDDVAATLADAADLVEEATRSLRAYADHVVVDPDRLLEVDQRLQLYRDLARKYGGSTAAAAEFLEAGRERLAALAAVADDLADLSARREAAMGRSLQLASRLSERRKAAAPLLESAIEEQLADLGMSDTRVLVEVTSGAGWSVLGPAGADTVTFLLAPNPGVPPRSLSRTASGGELSRTLLAIKAALAGLEGPETLVFDEIDAGVGGLTAMAVGRKLFEISRNCQMVVVTHLPQVAAYAETHYLIEKSVHEGQTITGLRQLDDEGSLLELSRMLGGETGDSGALEHARTLRDRATLGLLD